MKPTYDDHRSVLCYALARCRFGISLLTWNLSYPMTYYLAIYYFIKIHNVITMFFK